MQPAAAKIERHAVRHNRVRPPADAVHRVDQQHATPLLVKPPCRSDPGSARADYRYVCFHSLSAIHIDRRIKYAWGRSFQGRRAGRHVKE